MNFPEELRFAKSHEWVRVLDDGLLEIGISDFAQDQLGDVVFANLPEAGDKLTAGESFADVESVKAVSDIYSPVTGTVEEVNQTVLTDPALINTAPYGTWLIRARGKAAEGELLSAAEYQALVEA
ncbi:MAG: glycine cleavage system protein GcvH [Spirochaetaceae bacterium]|jgi:glycine cleavage system H protein|nr:glycine cleavage system protein GcvH [Spirochaetaceae bacterium]